MSRILNVLQGLLALVFVLWGSLHSWSVWVMMFFGLGLPAFIGIYVAFQRMDTTKGVWREIIEILIYIGSVIYMAVWLAKGERDFFATPTLKWMAWLSTPSILFNLSIIPVGIFYYVEKLLRWLRSTLEFISGENMEFKG